MNRRLTGVARRALKVFATGVDVVRPPPTGLVVLLYHRVGAGSGGEVDLPLGAFERQLDHLVETRSVVSLDDGLDLLTGVTTSSRPPVVLTFDDGTADFVDNALPAIARRGLPVTLYVATEPVESGRPFWGDGPALSWAALREASGYEDLTIGSHGHAHSPYATLTPPAARDDLDRARDLIGAHISVDARHFAYPHAVAPTPDVEAVVRAASDSAALEGCEANVAGDADRYRLRRSAIQVSDGEVFFRRKVAGGLRTEAAVRGALARRRAASRVS